MPTFDVRKNVRYNVGKIKIAERSGAICLIQRSEDDESNTRRYTNANERKE